MPEFTLCVKRVLDVFIRGLNGDMSRMLLIQRPRTLPETYSACLEIQNVDFRNNSFTFPRQIIALRCPLTIYQPQIIFKTGASLHNCQQGLLGVFRKIAHNTRKTIVRPDEMRTKTSPRVRQLREWRLTLLSRHAM